MDKYKWLTPVLPYLAVAAGLFLLKSAWLALVMFHLAILATLLLLRPNIPLKILFKGANIKSILGSVLLCGASGIGLYFLWDVFGLAHDLPAQIRSLGLNRSTWIPFIAYFVLVNPLVEEYYWRGVLGSDTNGFYFGDVIYAGYHAMILLDKVPLASIAFALSCLTFIGWFWRRLKRRDGGLLAAVLGHMAADLSILLVVYLKTV
jgi:hypothetical protein